MSHEPGTTKTPKAAIPQQPVQQQHQRVTIAYTNQPCRRKLQFINGKFAVQKPQTSTVQKRNERERNRVKLINRTFATLRDRLPQKYYSGVGVDFGSSSSPGKKARKLSKVEVLKTATSYIAYLVRLLESPDGGQPLQPEAPSITAARSNSSLGQQQQQQPTAAETPGLCDLSDLLGDSSGSSGSVDCNISGYPPVTLPVATTEAPSVSAVLPSVSTFGQNFYSHHGNPETSYLYQLSHDTSDASCNSGGGSGSGGSSSSGNGSDGSSSSDKSNSCSPKIGQPLQMHLQQQQQQPQQSQLSQQYQHQAVSPEEFQPSVPHQHSQYVHCFNISTPIKPIASGNNYAESPSHTTFLCLEQQSQYFLAVGNYSSAGYGCVGGVGDVTGGSSTSSVQPEFQLLPLGDQSGNASFYQYI